MNLNPNDIKRIARLARLSVADEEISRYANELSHILSMVARMQNVDTTDVEPMAHPLAISQRLRDDVVSESDQRDLFQSIAPQAEAGLYLVPRVIE